MVEREKVFGHKFLGLVNLVFNKFWDMTKVNLFCIIFYIPAFVVMFLLSSIALPVDLDVLVETVRYTTQDAIYLEVLVRFAVGLLVMTIPVVVFGPAAAGATSVYRSMVYKQPMQAWSVFWATMKKHFVKSLLISFISTLVIFVALLALRLWLQLQSIAGEFVNNLSNDAIDSIIKFALESNFVYGLIIVLLLGFIVIFMMMHIYIYPLLVQYDLKISQLYKYSYTFAFLRFLPNVIILIACIAVTIIPFWIHYLFGGGMMFLVTFGLCGLLMNYYTWPAIEKHFDPLTIKK